MEQTVEIDFIVKMQLVSLPCMTGTTFGTKNSIHGSGFPLEYWIGLVS
jgi:hypothetical protein